MGLQGPGVSAPTCSVFVDLARMQLQLGAPAGHHAMVCNQCGVVSFVSD